MIVQISHGQAVDTDLGYGSSEQKGFPLQVCIQTPENFLMPVKSDQFHPRLVELPLEDQILKTTVAIGFFLLENPQNS